MLVISDLLFCNGLLISDHLPNKDNIIKVYTEGFRVQVLNRRAIGCKSLNLSPII